MLGKKGKYISLFCYEHLSVWIYWSDYQFQYILVSTTDSLNAHLFIIFTPFRFASIVAKRLESLGALTHGDRRATETRDLSQFNLDTRYGRAALDILLRTVIGMFEPPLIPPPKNYKPGDFFAGNF